MRGHELVLRAVVDGGVHTVALLYVGDESIEEVGWRACQSRAILLWLLP